MPPIAARKQSVVTSLVAAAAAEANCLKVEDESDVPTNGPPVELCCVVEQVGEAVDVPIVCDDFEVAAPKPEVPTVTVPPASAMVSEPLVRIAEYFTSET
mgnify:CR=1 FL=1